jgi:hypothetical protein
MMRPSCEGDGPSHYNCTKHLHLNDLTDPEPFARGVDYASLIESDVLVVVQNTGLDSRQAENALAQHHHLCRAGVKKSKRLGQLLNE